jgi:hypothetical protein
MIKDEFGNRRFFGVYRGTVVNNQDPLGRNRVQVKVPQLFADEILGWAWPEDTAVIKTKYPAVNQGVWVHFEGGDPSHPVWSGTFGKVADSASHVLVTPPTTIPEPLVSIDSIDGVSDLDLVASLVSLANQVNSLAARVATLEGLL